MQRSGPHPPRAAGRTLAIAALVLGLLALVVPGASGQTQTCTPGDGVGCINGTIRTAAGDPAVGIRLEAEGPGGTFEATTGDTGAWAIAVEEAGDYAVTLDESTLPAGETLRDPEANPRIVTVALGRSTAALFPLGAPTGGTGTGGESTTSPSGEDTTAPAEGEAATPEDTEAEVASESAATSGNNRVVQLLVSGLIFGLLLALASVGANLIYGTTGLSNFSHGEMVTLGGLVAYMGVQWWGLPLWLALVVAVLAGGIVGWLLDAAVFSRLRKRGVGIAQQLIVTIGIALAGINLFLAFFRADPLPIVSDISRRIDFGLFSASGRSLIMAAVAAVVLAGVALVLSRTRLGRATRAVSDNAALASASGINVNRIVRGVWVSAGSLAALGGALMGIYLGSTRFNFGSVLLLLMFAAITLGGLGSPMGGLFGALVIGIVVEMSTLFLANDLRYATALVILILVLLVRPQGILGRAQRIG